MMLRLAAARTSAHYSTHSINLKPVPMLVDSPVYTLCFKRGITLAATFSLSCCDPY
jgi:hypothetical protein